MGKSYLGSSALKQAEARKAAEQVVRCITLRHRSAECEVAGSRWCPLNGGVWIKSQPRNDLFESVVVATIKQVEIAFDPDKRAKTLEDRGLDFWMRLGCLPGTISLPSMTAATMAKCPISLSAC